MAHSFVLALAAPKEGNMINKVKSNKKAREKTTKTKRKRMSRSQIQKVSPYFTNDCENKVKLAWDCGSDFESGTLIGACENILQEKGEQNGDEIATESVKFQRKRASKKPKLVENHEVPPLFQSYNRKVDAGSLDYDVSVGSVASPGSGISFLVDKVQEIGNEVEAGEVKFRKRKKKAFEGKLLESRNETKTLDAKTNEMKLKAQTKGGLDSVIYASPYFHKDGGKRIEQQRLESHVDGIALTATPGDFFGSELQESGKEIESIVVKSKKRKSKNKKMSEECAEVRKVSPYFQKDNVKKMVHVDAVEDKSGFHSDPLRGTCGYILQDKVKESGDETGISMTRSEGKRSSKKHEPVEHDQIENLSPYFQNDNGKLDAESQCYGHTTSSIVLPCAGGCFLENNLTEKGNIESKMKMKKKKKKAISDTVLENGNSAVTSRVKFTKKRLKIQKTIADGTVRYVSPYFHKDSGKKINVKPLDVEGKSESTVLPTFANIMDNKLQDNDSEMKINRHELEINVNSVALTANSGDFFEDKLQESGNEIETIAIKSKKKRKTVNQKTDKEIRKVSAYFQYDDVKKTVSAEAPDHDGEFNSVASCTCTNFVQDKREENGHIIAKRIKPKGHESLEHAQIRKFSPFFQSSSDKRADAESCYGSEIGSIALSGSGGSFLEDVTEKKKIKSNKRRKAIADKLQENGNDTETSNFNTKTTTPIVQKNIANGAVKHVPQYFHNASGKKINVKTCNEECKSESIALPACGKLREGKLQETHGKKSKQQEKLESHLGSVPLTARDLFKDELQEKGNEVDIFEIFSYRRNSKSQKTMEHDEVRKVSPYFQTQCLTGCEQVEKAKAVRKNMKVTDSRTCLNCNYSSLEVFPYCQEGPNVKSKLRKKSSKVKRPLSASEKMIEAYKRKTADNTWKPPRSEFSLLQEDHAHDPWRVLVICMLLNLTTGRQAKRVLLDLFDLCPDAQSCTQVATEEIEEIIKSLGLQKKRSMALQRLSREYLDESWTHVTQLHGVGKYGADAYAIFCTGKWDQVRPTDSVLNKYWEFLHTTKATLLKT